VPKIINGVTCRTREESLKHIIKQANKGKIGAAHAKDGGFGGSCLYEYPSGNHCAVGCLLSKKQLKDLQRRELMEMSIGHVSKYVGAVNLEAVTGMTLEELEKLQRVHDKAMSESPLTQAGIDVANYCKEQLKNLKANV